MKKERIIFFLILLSFGCSINAQPKYSDKDAMTMLRNFYTEYIIEFSKMPSAASISKINKIKEKYCSASLLNKINSDELEYDPFLNAQDSNIECLRTLGIKKDIKRNKSFIVSYLDPYAHTKILIFLDVIQTGGGYKINFIVKP